MKKEIRTMPNFFYCCAKQGWNNKFQVFKAQRYGHFAGWNKSKNDNVDRFYDLSREQADGIAELLNATLEVGVKFGQNQLLKKILGQL